ncbi:hypothetical protein SAMN05421750_108207 [Agrobacterium pusense]|nr:hypothetical protein SAMN05421750_108207 [Agrobacterium pusense]
MTTEMAAMASIAAFKTAGIIFLASPICAVAQNVAP